MFGKVETHCDGDHGVVEGRPPAGSGVVQVIPNSVPTFQRVFLNFWDIMAHLWMEHKVNI